MKGRCVLSFHVVAVLLLCIGLAYPTLAITPYEIIDLGTLGGDESHGNALNESGQVIGRSKIDSETHHAFTYRAETGMQDLGILVGEGASDAEDINDLGQVVLGNSGRLFVWEATSGIVEIEPPPSPYQHYANAMNNLGQVVGGVSDGDYADAYIWEPSTGRVDLGGLGSPWWQDSAEDINDLGQVVGTAYDLNYTNDVPFIWDSTSGMQILTGFGTDFLGSASGINNLGQVVGSAKSPYAAFVWDSVKGLSLLGNPEFAYSQAYGINSPGQIVGYYHIGFSDRACVWQYGKMFDLNDLIPSSSGWELTRARDINNSGQLVGNGIINGETHAFLAKPVSENGNHAPVADAGSDRIVSQTIHVILNGTGYDEDNDPLTFVWQIVSRPSGSHAHLDDPTSEQPGFVADRPGKYVVSLVVNDGHFDSLPDLVTIKTASHFYTLTDLGPVHPTAINDHGQVVGWCQGENGLHAFFWTKEDGMTDLGTFGGDSAVASDINNNGQVLVVIYTYPSETDMESRTFLWTKDDGLISLGILSEGPQYSGSAINDRGTIVGGIYTMPQNYATPFLWAQEEGLVDLETLGGDDGAYPYDINNHNEVVGYSSMPGGGDHACLWASNGDISDLGDLGSVLSSVNAINELGQAVGYSETNSNPAHLAFSWTTEEEMVPLVGLVENHSSFAYGINNKGQIVGGSHHEVPYGILWEEGVLYDLRKLVIDASEWDSLYVPSWDKTLGVSHLGALSEILSWEGLYDAFSINEVGEIIGYGKKKDGKLYGYVLTPFSEPSGGDDGGGGGATGCFIATAAYE